MGNMKKHRQHHVWQYYLNAWSNDGQLHCLMDGRIFSTGTPVVAVERDFYKIGKLTANDIALIRLLIIDIKGLHPLTRKNHEDFLKLLTAPDLFEGESENLDDLIDTFRTNALEDYHAAIEASFLPLLKRALEKDTAFYSDDESSITFLQFLASQHMRTKAVKTKTIDILKRENNIDISHIWSIMSLMFATNIGMTLYLERKRRALTLVENTTGVAFITGDQPIINLQASSQKPPSVLSWYYPISPRLALFLSHTDEKPEYTTASLKTVDVHDLNAGIVAASHRQIFAQSDALLSPYVTKAKI
jgi:hypothetical protein